MRCSQAVTNSARERNDTHRPCGERPKMVPFRSHQSRPPPPRERERRALFHANYLPRHAPPCRRDSDTTLTMYEASPRPNASTASILVPSTIPGICHGKKGQVETRRVGRPRYSSPSTRHTDCGEGSRTCTPAGPAAAGKNRRVLFLFYARLWRNPPPPRCHLGSTVVYTAPSLCF